MSSWLSSCCFFIFFIFLFESLQAQQIYVNNEQLDCYNNVSSTLGYVCSNSDEPTCDSYLIFRSQPPDYHTPVSIGYLLNVEPLKIAQINNISDTEEIPKDTQVIVPVNCSCSGNYYQHNASYSLKYTNETYLILANNTYQGSTTCQAMMNQNPLYDSRHLFVGNKLLVPLRCACPSKNQSSSGVKYLLTYLIDWGDDPSKLSEQFGVDLQSLLDANMLTASQNIYPFTPFLIPLTKEPTVALTQVSPPPPPPPPAAPPNTVPGKEKSSRMWVFVVIGVVAGFSLLSLSVFLVCFFRLRRRREKPINPAKKFEGSSENQKFVPPKFKGELSGKQSVSSFSVALSDVVQFQSLTVYKYEQLQRATRDFSPDCRIKGSVYQGVIKGDPAAIKRMKGDVSNEIGVLKQLNHANVIRLSGYCLHEGNSYLVYEFAENGSLSDWLHGKNYQSNRSWSQSFNSLNWRQRVQIAYDIADGLNYLHNYTSPACIHKDLKSSNILLDGDFRAKVANFGLARTLEDQEAGLQLTRHVVGTQGYMAPEYLEHGLITSKLDVFAFGVVMLEILSGREAITRGDDDEKGGDALLSAAIKPILEGENAREKLRGFIDPSLKDEYPLDLAFTMAQLVMSCVSDNPSSRPTMTEALIALSKILSLSLDQESSSVTSSVSVIDCR